MKYLILLSFFVICSCTAASEEHYESITDPLLVNILALSEVTDLNTLQSDIEKNLWVKVYKLPGDKLNDCFPESHGICKYKYYISTSQLDDSPVINAYSLGELGEIVKYHWLPTEEVDTAILNITVNKYTTEALKYNKTLKNEVTTYEFILKPNKIQVTKK